MKTITVNASQKYDITVAKDLSLFWEKAAPYLTGGKVALITDETVDGLYPDFSALIPSDKTVYKYVIKAGERSKNAENYIRILNLMAEDGFKRDDSVITFGGGVVGDLDAFIASTYMRGISLVAVPTTLLSMVDSSVGGKTAINLEKGKNLCGTFYQPKAVYINPEFLNTLPKEEILCGLGEIVKYAYLRPDKKINPEIIDEDLIAACLEIKTEIVEEDERESGKRKLLNFGHTFGHAIEKASDFTVPHGICVAKGIRLALMLSAGYFGKDKTEVKKFENIASKLGLDVSCDYSVSELIKLIKSDKKLSEKGVDFVLIGVNGEPQIVNISIDKIQGYIR